MNSKYFKPSEYQCHCGCGLEPTQPLLDKLDEIRAAYSQPIALTCASRCPAHNQAVGGAKDSQHVTGTAADLAYTEDLAAFIHPRLEDFNVYMENPSSTVGWRHIQLYPPPSGKRVFNP